MDGKKIWKLTRQYYPFTFLGSALFLLSLFLLAHSYTSNNAYGFVVAVLALTGLALLVIAGRIQGVKNSKLDISWDSAAPLFAGVSHTVHALAVKELKRFPFFRLHFRLRGRLQVDNSAFIRYYDEITSSGDSLQIPLFMPLCGNLHVKGRLLLQDFLGLTSTELGDEHERLLVVQPAVLSDQYSFSRLATDGSENQNKFSDSDVERYYMREYVPGDRFRDINWKASSRGSTVYTRISPIAKEKTQVISILFRNCGKFRGETVDSILHLNYLKSWLITFLKKTRRENPNFRYEIYLGQDKLPVETDEEIENFSKELAVRFFTKGSDRLPELPAGGEIYVFSTLFDHKLSSLVHSFPKLDINLFRTSRAKRYEEHNAVDVTLLKGDWKKLLPGFWAVKRTRREPRGTVHTPNIKLLQIKKLRVNLFENNLQKAAVIPNLLQNRSKA